DRTLAYVLYIELLAPLENVLAKSRHVFVVADGPLAGLPLSLLVTHKPEGDDRDPKAMRETAWLMRHFAFTTLPAVNSLNVIRKYPPLRGAGERVAFRGFGAPVLGGQTVETVVASAAPESYFRG